MKNGCMENKTYRLNWVFVDKINESLFEAVANDMGKFPEKYKNVKVVERDKIIEALKNVDNYLQKIAELEQELAELKQKAIVLEKALELACERVKYFEEMQDREMGHFELFGYDSNYDLQAIIEQYKQQAKEMLENE